MSLIDALMEAYATQTLAGDKVVAAVTEFAPLLSAELPTGPEACALFWVNKACGALDRRPRGPVGGPEAAGSVVGHEGPPVELRELSDVSDGRSLVALLAFYFPHSFPAHRKSSTMQFTIYINIGIDCCSFL